MCAHESEAVVEANPAQDGPRKMQRRHHVTQVAFHDYIIRSFDRNVSACGTSVPHQHHIIAVWQEKLHIAVIWGVYGWLLWLHNAQLLPQFRFILDTLVPRQCSSTGASLPSHHFGSFSNSRNA